MFIGSAVPLGILMGPMICGVYACFLFVGFGLFVFVTVILFVSSPFIFVFELIVDKGMPPFEALAVSRKAVMANLSGVIGLVLLSLALSSAGVLFCYVGSILVTPLLFAAQTTAYRKVFPSQTPPAEGVV